VGFKRWSNPADITGVMAPVQSGGYGDEGANRVSEIPRATASSGGALPGTGGLGRDSVALTGTEALAGALAQTPEARSAQVAQASALVADGMYPPLVLIAKLSVLFAGQLIGKG
jgi:hypothetical protein